MFYVFSACIQILQFRVGCKKTHSKNFAILKQNNNKKPELSGSFLLTFILKGKILWF